MSSEPASEDDPGSRNGRPSGTAEPAGAQTGGTGLKRESSLPASNGRTGKPGQATREDLGFDLERRNVVKGGHYSTYVRVTLPHSRAFRVVEPGHLEATPRAAPPSGRAGTLLQRLKRTLIGSPISTHAQEQERLTKLKALAVLSSDAISSVAYATEASMAVLITAGLAALQINLALAACIATLMLIVGVSYRQTIHAYPNGGGSYIVARDNLGDIPGLVAAAALLIDYVLTVAVSVASGVDALVSAVPALGPYAVLLGVLFIALIAVVNLRGVRESGTIFAAPTYLFIASFLIMIAVGIVKAMLHGGLLAAQPPTTPPAALGWAPERLGIILILSAFAQGCSAMTGVEAISNGVPAFKRPEAHNAARTLEWMIATLVTLFLSTTFLAWRFGLEPQESGFPTLDSKIAMVVFTGAFAWFFYVVQIATLFILVLAANTSFADFPRLSSILARDDFAPHQFRVRGDRLAFSVGIIVLALLSGLLLAVFAGNVNELINLYALGVFTAFTLSQFGMVHRWLRLREEAGRGWRGALVANAVGAAATALVAGVIIFTKFDKGAWIVVVLVPLIVLTFRGIHGHYTRVRADLEPTGTHKIDQVRHRAVVPIKALDDATLRALTYASLITPNLTAVHVAANAQDGERISAEWDAWLAGRATERQRATARPRRHWAVWGETSMAEAEAALGEPPDLEIVRVSSGSVIAALLRYVDSVRAAHPDTIVTVVIPDAIPTYWWQRLTSRQRTLRLKLRLLFRPGVVVTDVPYQDGRRTVVGEDAQHIALVPIGELNRPAIKSLAYARSITSKYLGVHVAIDDEDASKLRKEWDSWVDARADAREAAAERVRHILPAPDARGEQALREAEAALRRPPQLVVIDSPYRMLLRPLLAYIDLFQAEHPDATLTVILPEFIAWHWWERLLHNQTAWRLKLALLARPGVVVTDVPYQLPR